MFKKIALIVTATALTAPTVFAADTVDYSALTAAADFAGPIGAIMAVAAALAGVLVVKKGANIVLGFFGR